LARDCPDKGQNGFGDGRPKGPVHNCKFFSSEENEWILCFDICGFDVKCRIVV